MKLLHFMPLSYFGYNFHIFFSNPSSFTQYIIHKWSPFTPLFGPKSHKVVSERRNKTQPQGIVTSKAAALCDVTKQCVLAQTEVLEAVDQYVRRHNMQSMWTLKIWKYKHYIQFSINPTVIPNKQCYYVMSVGCTGLHSHPSCVK